MSCLRRFTLFVLPVALWQMHLHAFAAEPIANTPEWHYCLRSGDNLISFARQHLINPDDWRTLQTLNKIKTPYRMQAGQVIRIPLHLVKRLPASAEVALYSGKAGIFGSGKTIAPVTIGQKITAGTELVTADKSTMQIKFADGSIVSMQPNSRLNLDTLSVYSGGGMTDTTLRLQQGKLETEANPKHLQGNQMQIVTPTAVAAVRGTKFRVSSSDATMTQETLDGKVALMAAGAEVAVDKGFGSLSEGGAPPLPPVMLLAAPNTDKLPATLEALPVIFNMPEQSGAVAWLGKVSTEESFNSIAAESQGAQISFNDLPDGKYFLKVRGKDNKGLEGYDSTHAFILNARPFAPQISAPAQGAVLREPNPELGWAKIEDANEYLLELASDADFKQMQDTRRLTSTSYKTEKNLAPGQYYWRLASVDAAGQGPFTQASSFTYKAKPSAADISQLKVKVQRNQVFVNTQDAPSGFVYKVVLHNDKNQQKNVWQTSTASGTFNFLLKEYGKQTLLFSLVDGDGVAGPESPYEFNAAPQ